jgi:hypothetical protein
MSLKCAKTVGWGDMSYFAKISDNGIFNGRTGGGPIEISSRLGLILRHHPRTGEFKFDERNMQPFCVSAPACFGESIGRDVCIAAFVGPTPCPAFRWADLRDHDIHGNPLVCQLGASAIADSSLAAAADVRGISSMGVARRVLGRKLPLGDPTPPTS